jgi:hypothetical protein
MHDNKRESTSKATASGSENYGSSRVKDGIGVETGAILMCMLTIFIMESVLLPFHFWSLPSRVSVGVESSKPLLHQYFNTLKRSVLPAMSGTLEAMLSLSVDESNVLPFTKGLTGVNLWLNSVTRYVEVRRPRFTAST